MTSLADVRRLERLGEFRQRRCERALNGFRQRLGPVDCQLRAIDERQQSLVDFIASQRADDSVLSHQQLMALLRRQAVLRRQLHNLRLERVRIEEESVELNDQMLARHRERQALLCRQTKYQALKQRLAREQRLTALRREDNESEEGSQPKCPKP